MTTEFNQNQELGALRSNITLTLHSQYASRLWLGRPAVREGKEILKAQIMSMPSCLHILSQIQKDAANDDPFADWYLIQFEEKVLQYGQEMKDMISKLVEIYANQLPDNIDIERCVNVSPITYPIYVNSQLGYKLIYLLSDFDTLARSVMTASHIALMTRSQAYEWLDTGAGYLRKCFGVIENYRHSGVTRQDVKENNARYQEAVKRFKVKIPADVLSGKKRAEFAPIIRNGFDVAEEDNVISGAENEEV